MLNLSSKVQRNLSRNRYYTQLRYAYKEISEKDLNRAVTELLYLDLINSKRIVNMLDDYVVDSQAEEEYLEE